MNRTIRILLLLFILAQISCKTISYKVIKNIPRAEISLYYSQPPKLNYKEICFIEVTGIRLQKMVDQLQVIAQKEGADAIINVHSQRVATGIKTVTGVAVKIIP